ncbi:MAG TPA: hypothetical protein VHL58_01600 [Thermoanaerobaculia bacterium]|nr:hypothetical protein [Thermoanaerobaculia bacterium]
MAPSFTGPPSGNDSEFYAAIKMGITAVERGDFSAALRLFRAIYEKNPEAAPVEGLSYYGLCLARVEKKLKLGADLCRKAIQAQFYDSAHHGNLIRIYLQAKNRRAAVKVLEEGLSRMPKDGTLLALRDQMNYRAPVPILFLHRDNPVNRVLGHLRYMPRTQMVLKIIASMAVLAGSVGGTLWYSIHNH